MTKPINCCATYKDKILAEIAEYHFQSVDFNTILQKELGIDSYEDLDSLPVKKVKDILDYIRLRSKYRIM